MGDQCYWGSQGDSEEVTPTSKGMKVTGSGEGYVFLRDITQAEEKGTVSERCVCMLRGLTFCLSHVEAGVDWESPT